MNFPYRVKDKNTQRNFDYIGSLGVTRTVKGWVTGAGVGTGRGFKAVRTGAGAYTITFDRPFSAPPVVTLGCGPGNTGIRYTPAPTTTTLGIQTYNSSTLALGDTDFSFRAEEAS